MCDAWQKDVARWAAERRNARDHQPHYLGVRTLSLMPDERQPKHGMLGCVPKPKLGGALRRRGQLFRTMSTPHAMRRSDECATRGGRGRASCKFKHLREKRSGAP
jgi:hypothetical protein